MNAVLVFVIVGLFLCVSDGHRSRGRHSHRSRWRHSHFSYRRNYCPTKRLIKQLIGELVSVKSNLADLQGELASAKEDVINLQDELESVNGNVKCFYISQNV